MKKISRSIILMLAVMIIASHASAEVGDTQEPMSVMISEFVPCVIIEDNKAPTGFDIELWEAIAKENEWYYEYEIKKYHLNILDYLEDKEVDVGIAGFTITEEREEKIDFSHHYFDSGLRILTLKSEIGLLDKIVIFWDSTKNHLFFYGLFLVIFAHAIYFSEKDDDPTNNDGSFDDKYFPGIFETMYYCVITASTVGYGDYACKKWRGRILTLVLVVTGITAFCNFTAVLSSEYTTDNLTAIKSFEDLKGRIVITQKGTPAVTFLIDLGADVKAVDTISQAYDWLLFKRGEALVFDSPIILHYAQNNSDEVQVVGTLFDNQYYGYALQKDSPFRQDINRALLKLRENGTYKQIYNKWFKKD